MCVDRKFIKLNNLSVIQWTEFEMHIKNAEFPMTTVHLEQKKSKKLHLYVHIEGYICWNYLII